MTDTERAVLRLQTMRRQVDDHFRRSIATAARMRELMFGEIDFVISVLLPAEQQEEKVLTDQD